MSESKVTSEKWIADLHNTQKYGPRVYAHIYSESKVHIASVIVQTDSFVDENARARVRLIAAAPDLADALKDCMGWLACCAKGLGDHQTVINSDRYKRYRATLSKATSAIFHSEGMMAVRIQRKRTKGWRMPEGAVYVGRGSRWGNPYKVGTCLIPDATSAVIAFAANLPLNMDFSELRGKDLACWCPLDQPCHADVLLELANSPSTVREA